ncbi:hypothetical protein JK232_02210 [Nissabacter archeti]|uniref:TonB C-terminal domain-containing protein n=1 Tax=Nissabacter archeti TaxID=1917880 RepID=A0ABS5JEK4_9GAMM|nr:hypothetical protein [Nissabacter archeti]MBS0967698.1 hypothetical protein [Nissabacter archeti]
MDIYKVTYKFNGDDTYRDVNIESNQQPSITDAQVIQAAMRDSARYSPVSSATTINSLQILMVTKVN